jgi:hypothetical protein
MARIAGLVRSLHLHVSMAASLGIAFFALSGLIANLREGKDRDAAATVPPWALASPDALAGYLQGDLHLPAAPRVEEVGPDLLTATADAGGEHLDIAVYRATAAMEVTRWQPLPPGLALDRAALAAWAGERFHRPVEDSDDADDPQREQITLRIDSVWQTHTITIDRPARRWGVSTARHALAKVAADLHTGRHASWGQRLLMDAIAITLLLSVVTGTLLGLVWMAKLRRRLLITAAFSGGLLCLIALLAGR